MICGDKPYSYFPYRSSSYLTAFFENLDLDYVHDGSTRYWWVRGKLFELNSETNDDDKMPPNALIRVIESLVHPDYFVGVADVDHLQAVEALNATLKSAGLEVHLDQRTGVPRLGRRDEAFVSTAIESAEAVRKITFSPAVFAVPKSEADLALVTVMMPFKAEFNPVYTAINSACDEQSMKCLRADDIWQNSTFMQDIFDLIYRSRIVVVDFSGRNPNVMYETGIAHTLGKVVVPITQSLDDVPSDLKGHRALHYYPNAEGLATLTSRLSKRINTIVRGGD